MAYMSAIAYESVLNVQAWNCKLCQEYKINLPKPFVNLTSGVRGFTVLSQIESLHRIYRNAGIYITGHGLGGAFAILAATDIKSLYQSADAVYTFGQPRVGNEQFASYYAKTLPETYRVINFADIVPHLPATSAGYLHSSFEEWYQTGMKTYKTCEGESPNCSNTVLPQSWSISDNNINNYITISTDPSQLTQDD
ncbi:lipase [Nymphaea colorata]|nr:lipase [Nymphaea colorata]